MTVESPELEQARKDLEARKAELAGETQEDEVENSEVAEETAEVTEEVTEAVEEVAEETETAEQPEEETSEAAEEEPASPKLNELDELNKKLAERDSRIEELTRKLNAEDGRRGGELGKLRQQVGTLADKVNELAVENETLKMSKAKEEESSKPLPKSVFDGINEEALVGYDEDALQVIAKVAQNIVNMNTPADPTEAITRLKEQNDFRTFSLAVERLAPGFIETNGDPDLGVEPDPAWLGFLDTPVNPEVSGETWSQMASRIGTPNLAAKAFKAFSSLNAPEEPFIPEEPSQPQVERPTPAEQVAPSKSKSQPSKTSSKQAPTLRRSDYNKFMQMAATPGGYTEETRAKLREYQLAELEGRLT